jgi:hypothetical protein
VISIFWACAGGTNGAAPIRPDALFARGRAFGRDFHHPGLALGFDEELQRCAGVRADLRDEGVPGVDALLARAHDAVARRKPGALGRVAGDDLADHRLERRAIEAQPDPLQRVGLDLVGRVAAQVERRLGGWPRPVCTSSAGSRAAARPAAPASAAPARW